MRSLRLVREPLAELTTADLERVVGGGSAVNCLTQICPTLDSCWTGTTGTN